MTAITLSEFNAIVAPRKMNPTADNERIIAKLAANGCTAENVKAFVSEPDYPTMTGHILRKFASYYYAANGKAPKAPKAAKEQKTPEPLPPAFFDKFNQYEVKDESPKEPKASDNGNAAESLKKALSDFIGAQPAIIDKTTIDAIVTEKVNALLKAYKPSTIEVKVADNIRPVKGSAHYMLADVLADLVNGENVYLYGPAGTGKTVLAKQAAEALGVPFYFTSKIDEVFQLTGFIDANGKYNETELYRCMQTGGVFLFDEMDASAPEALTAFNALLANGIMDFPAGKIAKPDNMYIIAAGNTNGRGGTAEYNTRQPIDCATLDRFVAEEIGYDPAIEKALGESFENKQLGKDAVNVVRVIRKFAERNGLEIIASYRTITRLGKLASAKGISKAVISCIKNKVSEDDYQSMKEDNAMQELYLEGNVFAEVICG